MTKKRVLGILLEKNNWNASYPLETQEQSKAYCQFALIAKKEFDIEIVLLPLSQYKKGTFSNGWVEKNGHWVKKKVLPKVQVILDKTSFLYNKIPVKQEIDLHHIVVNPWELDLIASDKLFTNTVFAHITPATFKIESHQDIHQHLPLIPTKKIVIKPRLGYGGKGIQIINKGETHKISSAEFSILQPFVDSSNGIKGLAESIHDLRIIFAGERVIASYIRTPQPNSLICNIGQHGKARFLTNAQIPKQLREPIRYIQKTFAHFPYKLYTADFFFQKQKPLLIEINTRPPVYFERYPAYEKKLQKLYLQYLATFFKRAQ